MIETANGANVHVKSSPSSPSHKVQ